jgi:amidase
VTECWQRARALQPQIKAFAYLPEAAPAAGSGPLAGVVVGVKDLIDTADMPTGYGSPIHEGSRPSADAAVVARLRALGATVLGKTVTTEFAWRHPGPTRNPWDVGRTPGGSSSGSAAAVAAGIVTLALGTQTLGSVIRPAAFCGVVGFKPSFGTLPREGVHPLSGSLDHVGLFARTVEDIACAFALLTETDPEPAPSRPLRIAAFTPSASETSEEQMAAFEVSRRSLEAHGWDVASIEAPELVERSRGLAEVIIPFEAAQIFGSLRGAKADLMSRHITDLVDAGRALPAAAYEDALGAQRELRAAFAARMEGFDALLTIPATGEAPAGLDSTGDARFCAPWTVLGAPAISLPVALSRSGLPLGVQLVGRVDEDLSLLAAASAAAAVLPRIDASPRVAS